MIDSHCHLDHEKIYTDLQNIIFRSKNIGIKKILTISTNLDSFNKISKIVQVDPIIYGTFGIHPHETKNEQLNKYEIIEKASLNKKIIGVGESGLDFYYNNSDKESQIASFRNHIEASIDLNLPIIIHSRSAETEMYNILSDYSGQKLKILMHCFTGSSVFANKLMKFNSYFSASGIITFKNSLELQETFREIDSDRLLVETDSPFLSPEPLRGKNNEPSFIKHTLEKLSSIKKVNFDKMETITTNNFNRLFN